MSLHFIKAGLQTSIQDSGRTGMMNIGVSRSGAMDLRSMKLANWLLGKPVNSALLEITLIGPSIRFERDLSIAITGAKFDLYLNGNMVFNDEVINIEKGDVLEFDHLQQGARAYLAFTGELDLQPTLDSFSTHLTCSFGGFKHRQLKNNDVVHLKDVTEATSKKLPDELKTFFSGNYLIRCVASVETIRFSNEQIEQFYQQKYQVSSNSNRMGVRLNGQPLEFKSPIEIVSSGLTLGSVQIPPSGEPIISSVDGQTIGGYPRIANVIAADLPLVGQLRANDKINFTLVELEFADQLYSRSNLLTE